MPANTGESRERPNPRQARRPPGPHPPLETSSTSTAENLVSSAAANSARSGLIRWLLELQGALPAAHVLVIARQERIRFLLPELIQRAVLQRVIHRSRAQRGRREMSELSQPGLQLELAGLVAAHKSVEIGSWGTGSSLTVLVESQS